MTSAKNEARYIGPTIESILAQTRRPVRWIIVDDGSYDDTAAVAARYAARHPFIALHTLGHGARREFGSKVRALTYAFGTVTDERFDFVGILDADITLPPDYYERLMDRFSLDPGLGVGGGECIDVHPDRRVRIRQGTGSVRGGFQFFRRECYERVAPFPELPGGGEDSVAELRARKLGWTVRAFPDLTVYHHKPTGTYGRNAWQTAVARGAQDHTLGNHPLFELFRCLYRSLEPPYAVGGAGMMVGYVRRWASGRPPAVDSELLAFLRREQLRRLLPPLVRGAPGTSGATRPQARICAERHVS